MPVLNSSFAAQPPSGNNTVGWWRLGGSSRATCRSRWSLHLFVGVISSFNKLSSRRRRRVHKRRQSESEAQLDNRFMYVSPPGVSESQLGLSISNNTTATVNDTMAATAVAPALQVAGPQHRFPAAMLRPRDVLRLPVRGPVPVSPLRGGRPSAVLG